MNVTGLHSKPWLGNIDGAGLQLVTDIQTLQG